MSTSAQSIVDAIDAAILVMQTGGGAQSVTIEGKAVTYRSLPDLLKARAYYQGVVNASGNSDTGGIRVCKVSLKGLN